MARRTRLSLQDTPRLLYFGARFGACHDTPLQLAAARYSVGIRGRFWYDATPDDQVSPIGGDFEGVQKETDDVRKRSKKYRRLH